MSDLHRFQPLIDIYETVLFTAAIPQFVPLSVIFVGPSGAGKSRLLKRYGASYIHHTDSVTTSGLFDIIQRDPKNEIKFIVIPDINPTMTRKSSTVGATVGNLLSLTGDGTVRADDGRGIKEMKHNIVGLVTACTPEIYDKHAKQWFALGLRRRIVPVFYGYSTGTVAALQKMVREGKISANPSVPRTLPSGNRPVFYIGKQYAHQIEALSMHFSRNLGKLSYTRDEVKKWTYKEVVPIAPHVVLRALACAHAMRRRAKAVEKIDMEFLTEFIDFTDPENPKRI